METKNIPLEELKNAVGEDHVREAGAEDAVDGVEPSHVVEPGSVEEASAVLRLANEAGLAVAPRGGGTKMGLGNPPEALDLIVSTARLNEVVEYVPGDQVVRVQGGMRLEDLQERLAESDQILGIDPPEGGEGATLGGIVATDASGPRRLRYGTMRDLIIGIRVVLADGTVAKAGGKVVKNVAGYDLSKLYTGSLGTLGLIAETNFRLHPLPEASRTVSVEIESPEVAREAAWAMVKSQIVASAVELDWNADRRTVSVLIEGIEPAVEAQSETARFLFRPFGEVRADDEVPGPVIPQRRSEEDVTLKVNAPPAELAGVLESVTGAAGRKGLDEPRITGHAAVGVTYAGLSGGDEDGRAEVVEELREIWTRRGGSVVVLEAPTALKRRVGVWGAGGDYLGLMRRVKEKFDPRGAMNPGRFVGGI